MYNVNKCATFPKHGVKINYNLILLAPYFGDASLVSALLYIDKYIITKYNSRCDNTYKLYKDFSMIIFVFFQQDNYPPPSKGQPRIFAS
jgi:hypothetical protein